MKIIILSAIGIYLTIEFLGSFMEWMHSKNNREYWWRFGNTAIAGILLIGFAKLLTILVSEVA